MSNNESSADVMELLARARAKAQSPEEQALLSVAIEAILFITSTGQRYPFEDFRKDLAKQADADAWLSQ